MVQETTRLGVGQVDLADCEVSGVRWRAVVKDREASSSLQAALDELAPCEPPSLDQLDRTVRLLADLRPELAIFGAWVIGRNRFMIVLSQDQTGPVGYMSETLDDEDSFSREASRILDIAKSDVDRWNRRGWQRHSAAWNSDPNLIATPWSDRTQ